MHEIRIERVVTMVVRFIFGDAREWKYIVDSLSVLIEEANFTFTPDGIKLRALDSARIAMVELELPIIVFEEYECSEETNVGINIDDLSKVLKRGRADERVEFEISEGRLRVKIVGKASRIFSLPLIAVTESGLGPLQIKFDVKAKLLSDTLKDAVRDIDQVSENTKFTATEDSLSLKGSSDKGEVEVVFDRDSGALIEYEIEKESSATYSTKYLVDMLKKAASLSDVATLEFSTDKPLALTFEIAGGGRLTYYLAPRTE